MRDELSAEMDLEELAPVVLGPAAYDPASATDGLTGFGFNEQDDNSRSDYLYFG